MGRTALPCREAPHEPASSGVGVIEERDALTHSVLDYARKPPNRLRRRSRPMVAFYLTVMSVGAMMVAIDRSRETTATVVTILGVSGVFGVAAFALAIHAVVAGPGARHRVASDVVLCIVSVVLLSYTLGLLIVTGTLMIAY